MQTITEAYIHQIIIESLENPYTLNHITQHIPDGVKSLQDSGYSQIKLYKVDEDPRHGFFVGYKDGAYEVHHQFWDKQDVIGKNVNPEQTPSKFVSTSFKLIKDIVDKGHRVRIVAPDYHVRPYHRLIKKIAPKVNASVTDPIKREDF